jgi:sec-independent protein translocase protein TatA
MHVTFHGMVLFSNSCERSTMLGFIGYQELLIIMVIVLILFGGARLPSLMRNLGKSAVEFKRGMREEPDGENSSSADDK